MNQNSFTESSISPAQGPSADEISRRAYELWEKEGRPDGSDLRHWLQAEHELASELTERPSEATAGQEAPRSTAPATPRNTGTDVRPLQGTRAAAAAQRDTKRTATTAPFERSSSTSGPAGQNAAKRKPGNAPIL